MKGKLLGLLGVGIVGIVSGAAYKIGSMLADAAFPRGFRDFRSRLKTRNKIGFKE